MEKEFTSTEQAFEAGKQEGLLKAVMLLRNAILAGGLLMYSETDNVSFVIFFVLYNIGSRVYYDDLRGLLSKSSMTKMEKYAIESGNVLDN